MMPDLGKYGATVLGAYGLSVLLIVALVAWVLWRGARVTQALARAEARKAGRNG
jgi:heme exporter protein D